MITEATIHEVLETIAEAEKSGAKFTLCKFYGGRKEGTYRLFSGPVIRDITFVRTLTEQERKQGRWDKVVAQDKYDYVGLHHKTIGGHKIHCYQYSTTVYR